MVFAIVIVKKDRYGMIGRHFTLVPYSLYKQFVKSTSNDLNVSHKTKNIIF